jgi:hypothetical protein
MADNSDEPAAIDRDLASARQRLDRDLTELQARLSPGQLLDEGLAYLRRSQGADFFRNLGDAVKERPLPVALMGASLAWLATSGAGPRRTNFAGGQVAAGDDFADRTWAGDDLVERAWGAGRGVTRNAEESETDYRGRVAEARAQVLGLARNAQETAEAFADRVEEMMMSARQRAASGWSRLSEGAASASARASERGRQFGAAASRTGSQMSDAASRAGGQIGDAASRAGSQISDVAGRAGDSAMRAGGAVMRTGGTVADTIGGNPVLLGALGMLAGAFLGAVMPLTRYEEEMLREPARRAGDMARGMASDAMTRGTEAVRSAAQAGYSSFRERDQSEPQAEQQAGPKSEPAVYAAEKTDTISPVPQDKAPGFDAGAASTRH